MQNLHGTPIIATFAVTQGTISFEHLQRMGALISLQADPVVSFMATAWASSIRSVLNVLGHLDGLATALQDISGAWHKTRALVVEGRAAAGLSAEPHSIV